MSSHTKEEKMSKMTRAESYNKLVPVIDQLNAMIGIALKQKKVEASEVPFIIDLMEARILIECAGSLAVIADAQGLDGLGDDLIGKLFGTDMMGGDE